MKPSTRTRTRTRPPGLVGTARAERRTSSVLPRLRPGDVAVLDHLDMDRATAQRLVDAEVAAVLNAAPMFSGRHPALGPRVLVDAGVLVLDRVEGLAHVRDGARVRVHDGVVHVDDRPVATGREVDVGVVDDEMEAARRGLATQLETFTHNTTAFLRREEDLLLHGIGLPRLATDLAGRTVVVVVPGHQHHAELAAIRAFLREQDAVLVGVDRGADALLAAGHTPDVVVLGDSLDDADRPSAKALRAARDVVVRVERGGRLHREQLERLGVRPLAVESSATTEDAALLMAAAGHARLVVGVGVHAALDEFLDRQRPGLASTFLTRLALGERLVDARAVAHLYDGRVRPRHVLLVLLAGLLAVAAAVAVTPVGQEWLDHLLRLTADLTSSSNTRGVSP